MKMTNLDVINIINTLEKFGEKKMPQKISYAITRNLIIVGKDYSCYEKELKKVFQNHQEDLKTDENGEILYAPNGMPLVKDGVGADLGKEISDLLNIEIDVNLYQIDPEVFDYSDADGKYDALSPVEIVTLQSILCRDEELE